MTQRTLGATGVQVSPLRLGAMMFGGWRGNSRRWIFREVEASLRRLRTDWIDLYQVHRWDAETDLDETLGALSDLGEDRRRPSCIASR